MANQEQLAILRQGVEVWNKWRNNNRDVEVDLKEVDLTKANLVGANFNRAKLWKANFWKTNLSKTDFTNAHLSGANLSTSNLTEANLFQIYLSGANLFRANLSKADLRKANLQSANLKEANLSRADLREAILFKADLTEANLSDANLFEANLLEANLFRANIRRADLSKANLIGATLVGTEIDGTKISGSTVYGINVWNLIGEFDEQKDLIIAEDPVITVDNIKIAQFIYLILDNEAIRDVINTLTSKSVLILGRFALPERKAILDALRSKLREYNLLPIVFDFDRPTDKDYTETVQTLAGLSLFVIVDVTDPKSTPLEMEAIVKQFKIPYVPIINLSVDKNPFAMIVDSQKSFHWVLPTFGYFSKEELLENIDEAIINRALDKHNDLRELKATEPEILTIADLKNGKAKG